MWYNGGMFGKLRAIAWFTAVEVLGHPATVLLTLAAAGGTLVLPMLQFQRFSEDGRLARDCGLATALLLGVCLAIGGAGRLHRSLRDGTSAIALVKPLRRGVWLVGQALGTVVAIVVCFLTQGAAVLLAEAFSPQYHTVYQSYANVSALLGVMGAMVGALVVGAVLNRFRGARFPLTVGFCLPLFLWGMVPWALWGSWEGFPPVVVHWGSLSALGTIFCLTVQLVALSSALAVVCGAGLLAGVTVVALLGCLRFLFGAAFLPLDALAGGGSVALGTVVLLLPQTVCFSAFALWCGTRLLYRDAR